MPEPSDNSDPTETQNGYSEAIVKGTRFLISTGIILFVLLVIVGQELREYRTKQANFAKQIKEIADDKREVVKGDKKNNIDGLNDVYAKICKDVRRYVKERSNPADEADNTGESDRGEQFTGFLRMPGTAAKEDPRDNVERSEPNINITFAELIDGCDEFEQREEITDTHVTFPLGTSGIRKSTDIEALVRDEQKLSELVAVLEEELEKEKQEEKRKPKSAQREKVDNHAHLDLRLVKNLADYRNKYRRFIDLTRELFSLKEQSRNLNSAKNSIPTPFGNFDIAPRLALLGLAYSTILAYLSFYGTVRKIGKLASDRSSATREDVLIPAPFWSPNSRPTHKRTILLSLLVHGLWLSTAIWLTVECVYVWTATKVLAFDNRVFWQYLLIALLVATVIAAVWLFLPQRFKGIFFTDAGVDGSMVRFNRRWFVGAGIAGAAGLVTVGWYRFLRKNAPILPEKKLYEFTANPDISTWIQHKKNKKQNQIIHHVDVCGRHLPAADNRRAALLGEGRVHVAYQARIFERLGMEAKQRMLSQVEEKRKDSFGRDKFTKSGLAEGEQAIVYFKKALAVSPLSIHLYDRLRSLYGSLERYDQIDELLKHGLKYVNDEAAIARATGSQQRHALLQRTAEELKARVKTTKDRAERAGKRKAPPPSDQQEKSPGTNGDTPA